MADRAGEDHKCYPSIARLTKDTCLNRKADTSVMGRLRDVGLIVKTGRMVRPNIFVPEYQLVGVLGREDEAQPTMPKNNQTQKRATESPIEPPNESSSYYCAKFEPNSTPTVQQVVICTLPLNDGSKFEVTQDFVAELAPLYPNVDVVQALRFMNGWLIGNAKKRKTRRGIKAFTTSRISQGQAPQPRSYRDCLDLEQRQENKFLSQL